jgi:hypothetical protein
MVQNTLLSRILGLHKIHVYDPRASVNDVYHVLVIANTFPDPPDFVYDLKGSRHNRLARVDGAATALKDQDWLNDGRQLRLGHFAKEIFISQLQQDTQWIRQAQVNDYSLLVGVRLVDSRLIDRTLAAKQLRDLEPRAQTNSDNAWYQYDGGFIARTDNGEVYIDEEGRAVIYYFSLIDLYTVYDSARQEEHRRKAKTPELALAISCVPPSKYYERFIDALRRWSI